MTKRRDSLLIRLHHWLTAKTYLRYRVCCQHRQRRCWHSDVMARCCHIANICTLKTASARINYIGVVHIECVVLTYICVLCPMFRVWLCISWKNRRITCIRRAMHPYNVVKCYVAQLMLCRWNGSHYSGLFRVENGSVGHDWDCPHSSQRKCELMEYWVKYMYCTWTDPTRPAVDWLSEQRLPPDEHHQILFLSGKARSGKTAVVFKISENFCGRAQATATRENQRHCSYKHTSICCLAPVTETVSCGMSKLQTQVNTGMVYGSLQRTSYKTHEGRSAPGNEKLLSEYCK